MSYLTFAYTCLHSFQFLYISIISRSRQWHPTPVLLPGKSYGRRSLVGCSPWGRWGSDTTERLHFHFSVSCIGEGNGNPLHCSCLENLRDGGAWWAAIYGVAQSQTWLKQLSSSNSSSSTSVTGKNKTNSILALFFLNFFLCCLYLVMLALLFTFVKNVTDSLKSTW